MSGGKFSVEAAEELSDSCSSAGNTDEGEKGTAVDLLRSPTDFPPLTPYLGASK